MTLIIHYIPQTMSADRLSPTDLEVLTALVERHLAPDARVEHNVKLPVLGTTRKRQCDVVIYEGTEDRPLITIVEVQKRSRKLDLTIFHGWLRKKDEVGAQRLFCVSRTGFPKSVIEDATTRLGPSVQLLDFSDNASNPQGFHLGPILTKRDQSFDILDCKPLLGAGSRIGVVKVASTDKIFSRGSDTTKLSLTELICSYLNENRIGPDAGEPLQTSRDLSFDLTSHHQPLWFEALGELRKVNALTVKLKLSFRHTVVPIPTTNLVYKLRKKDGALAWVAKASLDLPGFKGDLTVIASPGSDGNYNFSFEMENNLPSDAMYRSP